MRTKRFLQGTVLLFSVSLLAGAFNANAQSSETVSIEWNDPQILKESDQQVEAPSIKGQYLDGYLPAYSFQKKVSKNFNASVNLSVINTSPAPKKEVKYLSDYGIDVGELNYEGKVVNARKERLVSVYLFPYVRVNGVIHRIDQFRINYQSLPTSTPFIQKDFVANSVLAPGSGTWYRISVTQDGLYKIDKNFLRETLGPLGVDVDNLDPNHINIFGNGDGRLPENNSTPRTDDLAKNAIQIVGGNDGSFGESDFILFYGWGPHRIYANGTAELTQDTNPYTDVSYYFINVNSNDTPLRVQDLPTEDDPVTHTTTTHSYFAQIESDQTNLVGGGQRWYGDLFDSDLTNTYTFNTPNIDGSSPATFKVAIASNSSGGSGNTHNYSVGGTQLHSDGLPTVAADYKRETTSFTYANPTSIIPLTMTVQRTSPAILTYLDYISMNARRSLSQSSAQYNFRDLETVGTGNVTQYQLTGIGNGFVWDITDRHVPGRVQLNVAGSVYSFASESDTLREFVASNGTTYYTPGRVGVTSYQNIHGLPQADLIIVTYPDFVAQADRLANLHRDQGTTVHVVTTAQVYNEFSSGVADATAIKMLMKMFYDRGATAPETRPKHLLLFGDGTYDHKNKISAQNYVITYQVANSENHISSLVTDDYFGLLDDNEGFNAVDLMAVSYTHLTLPTTSRV